MAVSIALIGNPNTGKSTVFNSLTGKNQDVGNWPGKTVEKKTGKFRYEKEQANITDLPGTYSLSAYSTEELIARNFIVEDGPDVVVDIVDASNLERNLYLTIQLLELGANVVVALNMMDIAKRRGFKIDVKKLSELLGVPVVPVIANKGKGMKDLKEAVIKSSRRKAKPLAIDYGPDLEPKITEIEQHVSAHARNLSKKYGSRWVAVKVIEHDSEIIKKMKKSDSHIFTKELEDFIGKIGDVYGDDADIEIADKRYGYVNGIVKASVKRAAETRRRRSDIVDYIITNQYLGIPIFLLITFIMFQFVFLAADPFVSIIASFIEWISITAENYLSTYPEWVSSFIVSGVIGGIGNVLVFLPNIALLFLAIAVLEDSGYMARAAFVMDRLMGKIGLHGKAFIPLLLGFGCNVPAIMATRTLDNERDRIAVILINPLVPCSARLVVFVFLAGIFFAPQVAGLVVWSLILLSMVLVFLLGYVFRRFLFPGPKSAFVIELPPYHLPTIKSVLLHMWQRTREFVYKAGTLIFLFAIILWFLASLPPGVEYGSAESYIGQLGKFIEPLLAPLGFDWKGSVALLFGLFAKEVVISSFAVLYNTVDEGTLREVMALDWTPLQAYVFMVFTLLYLPCVAAMAVIKQETKSWKWTAFAVGYSLLLAWIVSYIILNIGYMLGYS